MTTQRFHNPETGNTVEVTEDARGQSFELGASCECGRWVAAKAWTASASDLQAEANRLEAILDDALAVSLSECLKTH